jgi:hypothetical protein
MLRIAKVRGKSPVSPGSSLPEGKEVFLVRLRPAERIGGALRQA